MPETKQVNPRKFIWPEAAPFMVLNAEDIEHFKKLGRVFACAIEVVNSRFESEFATSPQLRELDKAVRECLEVEQNGI